MRRSKNGQAVPAERLTESEVSRLTALRDTARAQGDLDVWLRTRGVFGYIGGQRVVEVARQLEVGESSVRNWLRWYAREGADGLLSGKRGASKPKLMRPSARSSAGCSTRARRRAAFPPPCGRASWSPL